MTLIYTSPVGRELHAERDTDGTRWITVSDPSTGEAACMRIPASMIDNLAQAIKNAA